MFTKGNQLAKLKGKHKRTLEWEALAEAITTTHAKKFNEVLESYLIPNEDGIVTDQQKEKFISAYLNVLNYFKPKFQSTTVEATIEPFKPVIVIDKEHEDEMQKFLDEAE